MIKKIVFSLILVPIIAKAVLTDIESKMCVTEIENAYISAVAQFKKEGYELIDIATFNRSHAHRVREAQRPWLSKLVHAQQWKTVGDLIEKKIITANAKVSDINQPTINRRLLHIAVMQQTANVVYYLLKVGALRSVMDDEGFLAEEYNIIRRNEEVARVFDCCYWEEQIERVHCHYDDICNDIKKNKAMSGSHETEESNNIVKLLECSRQQDISYCLERRLQVDTYYDRLMQSGSLAAEPVLVSQIVTAYYAQ